MKNAGIWLDKRNAVIVQLDGKNENVTIVTSEVDEGHPKGGYGSSTPYLQQDAVSEKHVLNRQKHQLKEYFQSLIDKVENVDHLLIMGPSESKNGLLKEISSRHILDDSQITAESADSMTIPQIKSHVRSYFANHL